MPNARYIELRSQLTVVIVCAVLLAASIYQGLLIDEPGTTGAVRSGSDRDGHKRQS
jgi:hypothetical protein